MFLFLTIITSESRNKRVNISLIMTPFFLDYPPEDNYGGRMTCEIVMMDVTCEAHCIRATMATQKLHTLIYGRRKREVHLFLAFLIFSYL